MSETSLRRVVSQSEQDQLLDEGGQLLRQMTVSSDEGDDNGGENVGVNNNNNADAGRLPSSSAMGTPLMAAPPAAALPQGSGAVWIEPPPSHGHPNAATTSAVGASSSAQELQLTEGSVLYVSNRGASSTASGRGGLHHHPMGERDLSSSSLSDDAEDDNYDREGNRGGLLRFVTALTGSRMDGGNTSNHNNAATAATAAATTTNRNANVVVEGPSRRQDPQQSSTAQLGGDNDKGGGEEEEDDDDDDMATSSAEESTMERTGSQNSSRDWGWFDDVHQSVNEVTAGEMGLLERSATSAAAAAANADGSSHPEAADSQPPPPQQQQQSRKKDSKHEHKPPKKKRGLVPQVSSGLHEYASAIKTQDTSDAAAAMAVTAPNYVLEESLSSQRLWKETAGQRPPQPAEERAFYEKMWAQNFARSNVEYGMPVEVLTATSPISLSPYFDAHYAASDPSDPSHHHHPHDGDYAAASGGGDAVTAVAEAALKVVGGPSQPPTSLGGGAAAPASGRGGGGGGGGSSHPGTSTILANNQMLVNRTVHHADGSDLIVLVKGDNVFGTTVSKSFVRGPPGLSTGGVDTVNISIASYRVVESRGRPKSSAGPIVAGGGASATSSTTSSAGGGGGGGGKYAQFLVIYREGSIRDTIGVWKRYSDFEELARKVTQSHEGCKFAIANLSPLSVTEESETEDLPNAITSWRLLKKRQRWYRCLDAGYLSLKVFLLERFLHDILFESSSPKLLRDFVGADTLS